MTTPEPISSLFVEDNAETAQNLANALAARNLTLADTRVVLDLAQVYATLAVRDQLDQVVAALHQGLVSEGGLGITEAIDDLTNAVKGTQR